MFTGVRGHQVGERLLLTSEVRFTIADGAQGHLPGQAIQHVPGRAIGRPRRARPAAAAEASGWMRRFERMEFSAFFRFFFKQPLSLVFLSFYLLFEYVRPQSIYAPLEGLPWATWCMAGAVFALVLEGRLFKRWSSADIPLLLYTGVLFLSCHYAIYPARAWGELYVFLTWVIVYFLITRAVDNDARYFFFMGLFMLFSLKMSQHATRSLVARGFSFEAWGASGAPGWFQNSGEMAIQMTIFLPISYYFLKALEPHLKGLTKRWKYWLIVALPATAALALVASSSRGGQIGGAAVLIFMIWRGKNRLKRLVILGAVVAAGWLVLPDQQRARFESMGEDETSQTRMTYWKDGIAVTKEHPVLGIGYENWIAYYGRNFQGFEGRRQLVHNVFLQASAELGYMGLAAFLLMIGWTFRMNAKTRKRMKARQDGRYLFYMAYGLDAALVGFMVSGFFVTVLYYPYFWINYSLTAALFTVARDKAKTPASAPAPVPERPVAPRRVPMPRVAPATRVAGAPPG